MQMNDIRDHKHDILGVAKKYGVSNIQVFGSVARGDAAEKSDVDLFVTMDNGRSLFDYIRFKREVEELLQCKVDVVDALADIHPLIRARIEGESIPL